MKKKTLIGSQDDRLRHALEFLFTTEPQAIIAGSSNNSAELLAMAQATMPDLVLFDWDLVDQSAPNLIAELQEINPATKTMVFSNLEMAPCVRLAGADVCITKGSQPDAILRNFRALFGNSPLS